VTDTKTQTTEPMIRFNGTGYGIKAATVVQALIILAPIIGGGYVTLQRLDVLEKRLSVVPADVQTDVLSLKKSISEDFNDLREKVEIARRERTHDIKDLERRASAADADRAKITQQVTGLERLMEDLRDLLRGRSKSGEK